MPVAPRGALEGIELPAHGGLDHAELESLGLRPGEIVDFSANLNPWGAPPDVREAIARADVSSYPDAEATALRRALAARLGLATDQIIAGNGSSELLWLIGLAFVDPCDRVLIAGPTFGEYERVARLAGAEVAINHARAGNGFRHDARQLGQVVDRWRPKVIFLCNPNNPTGHYLDRQSVMQLADNAGDSLLVLDEAYAGFVAQPWSPLDLLPRGVLVLRSLTKDYGLAGLRLGYAIGHAEVIAALRKVRPPWNVNAVAQAAGLACLADEAHVAASRRRLAEAKDYLVSELAKLGLRVLSSDTSFFLVEVDDARQLRARLLRRGLLVRDCHSFGLPRHVRIAARTLPECRQLVAAIGAEIGERSVRP